MISAIKTERTILVPLDAQSANSERLFLSAALAKVLQASVSGLFVVDARPLEAANLPFAIEISRYSAAERSLQQGTLASLNRKTASETERKLQEISSRYKISMSFSSLTGDLYDSAFSQPVSDILLFPRQSAQFRQWQQLSVTNQIGEVVVYCDASMQINNGLRLAEQLCSNQLLAKVTLLYEGLPPVEVAKSLRQRGFRTQIQAISTHDPLWLRSLHLPESSLVLIPRDKFAGLSSEQLNRLFASLKFQVLLMQ